MQQRHCKELRRLSGISDADDMLLPNAVEIGLASFAFADPACSISIGRCELIDGEGKVIGLDESSSILKTNPIWNPGCVIYRRSIFDQSVRFDTSLKHCEDYGIYLQITRRFPAYNMVSFVVQYRHHGNNKSRNAIGMLNTVVPLLKSQRKFAITPELRSALAQGVTSYRENYGPQVPKQIKEQLRLRH